jgi:hypothetical protein
VVIENIIYAEEGGIYQKEVTIRDEMRRVGNGKRKPREER